jgi:hypothetical protein
MWSSAPNHTSDGEKNSAKVQILDPLNDHFSFASFCLWNTVQMTIFTHRQPTTLATSQASMVPTS